MPVTYARSAVRASMTGPIWALAATVASDNHTQAALMRMVARIACFGASETNGRNVKILRDAGAATKLVLSQLRRKPRRCGQLRSESFHLSWHLKLKLHRRRQQGPLLARTG